MPDWNDVDLSKWGSDPEKKQKERQTSDFGIPELVLEHEKVVDPAGTEDWTVGEKVGEFGTSFMKHLVSSGTMGLTEFSETGRTKDWKDKNLTELWGASLGEAAGFLVPIAGLGKVIRGGTSLLRHGSKRIVRNQAKEAAEKAGSAISKTAIGEAGDATVQDAAENIIKKTLIEEGGGSIWQLGGKKVGNLYKYEVGGKALQKAEAEIGVRAVERLGSEFSKAGIDVSKSQINDIAEGFLKGLKEGKHRNSVASWISSYSSALPANSFWRGKIAKWLGHAADEAMVLSVDGVMRDRIRMGFDENYDPSIAGALGHGMALGAAFPAIRGLIKGGGKGRLIEGLGVMKGNRSRENLFAKWKNTDYSKLASNKSGREQLKSYLEILHGNKNITEFTNTQLKIGGKTTTLEDLLKRDLTSTKEGGEMAIKALNQLRAGISTPKALGKWAMDYTSDLGWSMGRMAVGSYVMNFAAVNNHVKHGGEFAELLPHLMIGAFMTKSRKGWMEGDMASRNVDQYFEAMRSLDINPKGLQNVVNWHKAKNKIALQSRGLIGSETAADIFDAYNKIAKESEGQRQSWSRIDSKYKIVKDYWDAYYRYGTLMDPTSFPDKALDPEFMNNSQLAEIKSKLENINYRGKKLTELDPFTWMNLERIEANRGVESSFKSFIMQLDKTGIIEAKENSDGTIEVTRPETVGKPEEFQRVDRMLVNLADQTGMLRIRHDKGLTKSEVTREDLVNMTDMFQQRIMSENAGPGTEYTWDIDSNDFINEMSSIRKTHAYEILTNSALGNKEAIQDKQTQDFKEKVVDMNMLDGDGRMANPLQITIKERKSREEYQKENIDESNQQRDRREREDLENSVREIASIYHTGASERSLNNSKVEIPFEQAQKIVEAFNALDLPIRGDMLIADGLLSAKKGGVSERVAQAKYEKIFPDKAHLDLIIDLEGSGLGWLNQENNIFMLHDYNAAVGADKGMRQSREQKKKYDEIRNTLGDKVAFAPKDIIRLEDAPPVDVTSIDRIHAKLPHIRQKNVIDKVNTIIDRAMTVDIEGSSAIKEQLQESIASNDYAATLKLLDNAMVKLPSVKSELQTIKEKIIEGSKKDQRMEDVLQNHLKDSYINWTDLIQRAMVDENIDRLESMKMLQLMLADKDNSVFYLRQLTERLEKELNRKGPSIEELSAQYMNEKGFSQLREVMKASYMARPSNVPKTEQYYEAFEPAQYSKEMRNDAGSRKRNNQQIITEFEWKDPITQEIKPQILEKLRTEEGIRELMTELAEKGGNDLHNFMTGDMNALLQHYNIQKKITKAQFKDGNLYFTFEASSSTNKDNTILERWQGNNIKIYELSGQGYDNGIKPVELINGIDSKIKKAGIRLDPKDNFKAHLEGEHAEAMDVPLFNEKMNEVSGEHGEVKYGLLVTGYSKPKVFSVTAENLTRIDQMFQTELRHIIRNAPDNTVGQNLRTAFSELKDPSTQLRVMHWFETNGQLAYEMFANHNFKGENAPQRTADLARRFIKYSTLFANELSKPISRELLREVLDKNPQLPVEQREAMVRIERSFDEIGVALIGDENFSTTLRDNFGNEIPANIFNTKRGHINQIQNDPSLTDAQRQNLLRQYGEKGKYPSLDETSAFDGIIVISKDMYLASKSMLPSGSENANALKPTIWHNTGLSTLLGKGMYIYIPQISDNMPAGVHMLMGGSAAKSVRGNSRANTPVELLDPSARGIQRPSDLLNPDMIRNENVMNISFSDQGLIKTSHELSTSPISHTLTYGSDKAAIKDIRKWMHLEESLSRVEKWDRRLKEAARTNLAQSIAKMEAEGGYESDQLGMVGELVNTYNYHHTNPIVKKQIFRMFKDQSLALLNSPVGEGKQGRYYIFPDFDLTLRNPYFTNASKGDRTVQLQTQFGEISLPKEYSNGTLNGRTLRRVNSIEDMQFSFKQEGMDYMVEIKINPKTKELEFELYDHVREYSEYGWDLTEAVRRTSDPVIPQALKDIVNSMRTMMDRPDGMGYLGNGDNYSFGRLVEHFNTAREGYNAREAAQLDANILAMIERSPRKGQSDFQMVKVRDLLPESMGAVMSVNSYDARVGLQADWDGDAVSVFYGQSGAKRRNAIFDAGLIRDYPVMPATPFELNPFGVDFNVSGRAATVENNGMIDYLNHTRQAERTMGRVLGTNNALTWFINAGFEINGQQMNVGYANKMKLEAADRFAHYAAASQSIVDTGKGVNKELSKNPFKEVFFRDGYELFGGTGEKKATGEEMMMAEIIFDVLKRPSRIFNDVTDRAGKHKPRTYEMNQMYSDLRSFFTDPNQYVLNEGLRRMKVNKVPWAERKAFISKFYDTKTLDLTSEDTFLKSLMGKKKPVPQRVVKMKGVSDYEGFTKKRMEIVKEMIDLSDAGYLLRRISEQNLFNDRGFIDAWQVNTKNNSIPIYADIIGNVEQLFMMERLLGGGKENRLFEADEFDAIFQGQAFGKQKNISNLEHLARLETALHYRMQEVEGRLEYLRGFKSANSNQVLKAEDSYIALQRANDMLTQKIKKQGVTSDLQNLKVVRISKKNTSLKNPNQSGYVYFYKVKNETFSKQDLDKNNIDKFDFNSISRDPIIVKAGDRPTKWVNGKMVSGTYIMLKNPIASKRLNADETINGYMMHLFTKYTPIHSIFPDEIGRQDLLDNIAEVKTGVRAQRKQALSQLKKGSEYASEIFTMDEMMTKELFDNFFKNNWNKVTDLSNVKNLEELFGYRVNLEATGDAGKIIQDMQTYLLAKTLLIPKPLARNKVTIDKKATPYYYTDIVLRDKLINYLRNNHKDVYKVMMEELGSTYEFIRGGSESFTPYMGNKSSLYGGDNIIGLNQVEAFRSQPRSFTRFAMDPAMMLMMRDKGVMVLGENIAGPEGTTLREIRDIYRDIKAWESEVAPSCAK